MCVGLVVVEGTFELVVLRLHLQEQNLGVVVILLIDWNYSLNEWSCWMV